ncbi:hypothetical protein HDU76_007665, partial [Blyttiomyces sp. JEL0837]
MYCVEPTDQGVKPAMDDPVTPQTPVCHDPSLIGPPLTADCVIPALATAYVQRERTTWPDTFTDDSYLPLTEDLPPMMATLFRPKRSLLTHIRMIPGLKILILKATHQGTDDTYNFASRKKSAAVSTRVTTHPNVMSDMNQASITSLPQQPPPDYFPIYSENVPRPPMPTPYVSSDPLDNTTTITNEPPLNDDAVAEYNTSTQKIGYGRYIGSYIEKDNVVEHLSTWGYLAPYLRTLIERKIIIPTPNLYVAIHLAPGITVDEINPNIDCLHYCGFHTSMYIGSIPGVAYNYLAFGIMVDQGPLSRCMGPCGWNHNWIGNSNSLASHELAEAITDPAYPASWYRKDVKAEIADYCNTVRSTVLGTDGVTYVVTPLWSNVHMDCINPKIKGSVATSTVMLGLGGKPLPTYSSDLNSCHDVCTVGAPLNANCNACTRIVVYGSWECGSVAWSMICVWYAEYWCKITC